MKILFITNIPSPYRVEFFNELGKYIDLTVIFEAKRAQGIKFDWKDSYKNFKAVFLSDGDIQEKKFNFSILKYIKRNQYDYIFATNYSYRTELLAYLKMVFLRIPFVLEIDGGIIKEEKILMRKLKRFLLTKPSKYFSPSVSSDKFLMHYGAKKDNIIRYNFSSFWEKDILCQPITCERKKEIKKELGLDLKPLILCVSQIIHRKGIDVLMDALNNLEIDYQCLVIGEQPDKDYLSKIKNLQNNKVRLCSFKNSERLRLYYQAADVFVLPTRFDVWGLVVNEALANGLPVITTNGCVAGTELIKDNYNGFLVPIDDEEAIKDKIENVLGANNGYNLMCRNAIESVRNNTIDNMVKVHLRFLNDKIKS